eukprot:144993-Amphidinium_carterae.1
MTPRQAAAWWSHDHMLAIYRTMSGPWSELLQQHTAIHFLSSVPDRMTKQFEDQSMIQVYLHTSATNLKKCLTADQLGRSQANLKSGEVFIVQAQVAEGWLCDSATRCVNGYAISERVESMDIHASKFRVTGLVKVLNSMQEYLATEETTTLTRCSISHYECLLHSSALSEYSMLTPEGVMSLAMPHLPGACKVSATLGHQSPETAQLWEDSLSQIKSAWKAAWEAEMAEKGEKEEKSETSNQTTFKMSLASDSEATIVIKKIKRS